MNQSSEIVEVEGRTMLSASPKKLDEIIAARNGGVKQAAQLPGITKVERAAGVLQKLENRIERKPVRKVDDLVDFL
jgi:hypothetical protein